MRAARFAVGALAVTSACATLGTNGEGEVDLPNAGVGPFRKLASSEVLEVAPFVLQGKVARFRAPSTLPIAGDAAGDLSGAPVALYAVANAMPSGPDVLVRTHADDARSFFATAGEGHSPRVVLMADAAWEGRDLGRPSALWVGGDVFLYYAAAGGIGLALSADGFVFQKQSGPVLARDPSLPWETTPPSAPSVALFPDGSFHMLYASGLYIGEAKSADGVSWTRVDADPSTPGIDPVLGPGAPVDPSTLAPGESGPFDTAQVTDPCLLPRTTPAGRLEVRVLYTGYVAPPGSATRAGTIGFAARFADAGVLTKATAPVYSVPAGASAPSLFAWGDGRYVMLYVEQSFSLDAQTIYPAIAAAFAPPTLTLATPTVFATGP